MRQGHAIADTGRPEAFAFLKGFDGFGLFHMIDRIGNATQFMQQALLAGNSREHAHGLRLEDHMDIHWFLDALPGSTLAAPGTPWLLRVYPADITIIAMVNDIQPIVTLIAEDENRRPCKLHLHDRFADRRSEERRVGK